MRKQLRPFPTPEQLAEMYPRPHTHAPFPDHHARVTATFNMARRFVQDGMRVADLSCGDAYIAKRLQAELTDVTLILGDFAPGYPITGPIEGTINLIDAVDVFICSETLEHLVSPDGVLDMIRNVTDLLVLTTPVGDQLENNPEHLWRWDREDVEDMLRGVSFTPIDYEALEMRPRYPYCFGIWVCQ